jgi:dihydrolipoamide dehydrogenase
MGINTGKVTFDFSKIMEKKTRVVGSLTKGIEALFKKNKVDYVKGQGKFKEDKSVQIEGENRIIRAKNYIIATGSEPNNLPGGILPIDENRIISSTGALSLKEVPKKLIVVGGGVIGLELGSVYARLGSEVDVVEYADRILPAFDHEISDAFLKILKKFGLKFHLNHKVVGGSQNGETVKLITENIKDNNKVEFSGDYVLIATGRKPFTYNLGLDKIGLETDKLGRIPIDKHLQTKAPGIFAIGDVIEGPMLAHKGEEEGVAVVEYIVDGHSHINYHSIPNVVYTHPELAYVGYTEEEVKAKGK